MDEDPRPVASLAESITAADKGRQTPGPPLPKGWAGIVERDRRSRARSAPNAVGGYLNILYPWRLYIAVAGAAVVLALVVLSALR